MHVLRRDDGEKPDGARWLMLRSLEPGGATTSFSWHRERPDGAGDVFEVAAEVRGRWTEPARFAVYADWQVAPDGDADAFAISRRALFDLRVGNIETFHTDYLLRRVEDPNCLTVLGLYGDKAGLDLARNHPSIREWAQANAPAQWGARDASGMKLFRVEGQSGF